MKIYTKSGDKGRTSLATGQRVSKSDVRLEAYGTADELNSFVGLLRSLVVRSEGDWTKQVDLQLNWVQNRLFDLGAILAAAEMSLTEDAVGQLEEWIDEMQTGLPELRAFILPGGSEAVAMCHVCRTIARRLERHMVSMSQGDRKEEYVMDGEVMKFVNRLSDYCFVLARFIANNLEISIPTWEK
jgi:cob(I)alamin adenosyltransferase